jgi:hypothetical protein
MATQANNASIHRSIGLGSVLMASLIGGGIATVGNLILLLLAGVLNIPLTVYLGSPGPNTPIAPIAAPPVIFFSLLPAIIGGLLYFALTKISAKAATIFMIIAVIVALLSLFPIFGQPLGVAGMIVLILMHVVAAIAITWALVSRARS